MNLSSLDDKESGKVSRGSGIGSAPTKPQSSIDRQTDDLPKQFILIDLV